MISVMNVRVDALTLSGRFAEEKCYREHISGPPSPEKVEREKTGKGMVLMPALYSASEGMYAPRVRGIDIIKRIVLKMQKIFCRPRKIGTKCFERSPIKRLFGILVKIQLFRPFEI